VILITLATIPYTGWLLGYFVLPRMLARAAWFMPLGIGSVLLLISAKDYLKAHNISIGTLKLSSTVVGMVACSVFISPILFRASLPRAPHYIGVLNYYKQLAQVGTYIDSQSTKPVMGIALDYVDMQFLPGVSSQIRLISFRENNVNPHNFFMSEDEIDQRIHASDTIRSLESTVSEDERCLLISEYDMRYVVARTEDAVSYQEIVSSCEAGTEVVLETEYFVLIEFTKD
jgi:hypothetical protein